MSRIVTIQASPSADKCFLCGLLSFLCTHESFLDLCPQGSLVITCLLSLGARSRWLLFGLFLAVAGWHYSDALLSGLEDTARIPLIYVLCVPLLALIVRGISHLRGDAPQ